VEKSTQWYPAQPALDNDVSYHGRLPEIHNTATKSATMDGFYITRLMKKSSERRFRKGTTERWVEWHARGKDCRCPTPSGVWKCNYSPIDPPT
jgi:hypothetical protein